MSSDELGFSSSDIESEDSNYHRNSIHNSHTYTNQSGVHSIPVLSRTEEGIAKKEYLSEIITPVGGSIKNSSFPDINRVLGCINRVLHLSKYTPPNTNIFGHLPNNDIIAVIPAHNEELTIGMVVLLSLQHVGRVIVVDDGSQDRTGDVAQLAGAEVIHIKSTQGKVNVVRTGMERAKEIGFKAVVMIDANGLYNPNEIPYLSALVLEDEADMVIGSRFLRNQNLISSYQFTSKYPGFIAFSKKGIDFLTCHSEDQALDTDIAHLFSKIGLKVADIPITVRKKSASLSTINKVIIAMPAFNEEKNLPHVIKGALKYSNTILVVDDGSTDNTTLVAEEAGAIVVRHEKNLGYGGALNTIFSTARSMEADALVIIDSDGQHNPADIICLLEKLGQDADVVIGSRFLGISNTIPLYRQFGMKVLDLFTTAAGVTNITDSQSGFRAYNKKAINVLSICGKGMSAGSEILIQISDNNLKVKEVPITVRYDIEDTSTHNPVIHGFSVLSNIFGLINFRNPIIFFGIPALILIGLGLIVIFLVMYPNLRFVITGVNLLLISGILFIIGSIVGCEGYIFHHYINKSKGNRNPNNKDMI